MNLAEELEKCYKRDNYQIKKNNSDNSLCYIYFSSNALYGKDDVEDFYHRVVEGNRYEWMSLSAECKPALEIYVRDIYLSWYVKGINEKICNYDKLIVFLRELTEGYTVRCVGASSGGFIGNIIAMALNADISYCFAGQFSLRNHFDHLQRNPFLKEYLSRNGDRYFEYYRDIPNTKTKIIYLYPQNSEQDQQQYDLIRDMNQIHTLRVDCAEHGVAIYPFAVPRFLCFNVEDIQKFSEEGYTKKMLSIRIGGIIKFTKWFWWKVQRKEDFHKWIKRKNP